MKSSLLIVCALLSLMAGTAVAQLRDAPNVLQAAAAAMGANGLKSLEYSVTGRIGMVGQNPSPSTDWPTFEVMNYSRTVDYESKSLKEEYVPKSEDKNSLYRATHLGTPNEGDPPRFAPSAGEILEDSKGTRIQRGLPHISLVSGNYAWDVQDNHVIPAPADAEARQLEIALTPHGFLKAAMEAHNPMAVSRMEPPYGAGLAGTKGGIRRVTIVSITLGKYKINGMITDQNLVERIQTWIPSPALGDMMYVINYLNYKQFGDVKFPTHIHAHQFGEPYEAFWGANYLDFYVSDVHTNVSGAGLHVPDAVRQVAAPVRVESQKLADGVWLLAGGSHHSVAVEFGKFVAVVEAPLNEERSLAVIAEVKRLVPNKPIQYLVNTHHHHDHIGGMRTYAALGIPIVTNWSNYDFYRKYVLSPTPRTLMPDLLSLLPTIEQDEPLIIQVGERYVLNDGLRAMELYPARAPSHGGAMLIAYLPKEKILVESDLYEPPDSGARPPATPSASSVALFQQITSLKLDVAQIAPLHGRVGTMDEFVQFIGKAGER